MTIITHTPIWVWIVLILLIYLGLLQSKTRPIKRWRLLIMPVIFLPLSLMTLFKSANIYLSITTFILAMAISFIVANRYFNKKPIIYQNTQGQWQQRGSWLFLSVYLSIFICRYVISVSQAMHAPFINSHIFVIFMGLPMGVSLGVLFAINLPIIKQSPNPLR